MDNLGMTLSTLVILISYGVFTIGVFLALICVVVGVHEYGHYQMARWTNIKVLEFSLGFGKILFQKNITKDKTLFTLRALPFGGFVKPLDESSLSEKEWNALPVTDKNRAYNRVNRGKKILMILGGPLANFVLAFFLYICAMVIIGSPKYEPVIASITPNTLLAQTGIKAEEIVKKVNGISVETSKDAMKEIISVAIQGQKLNLTTNKNNYTVDFNGLDFSEYGRSIDRGIGIYFVGPKADYVIDKIVPGSVAEQAGLAVGDIIKEVDNKEIISSSWLINAFAVKAGQEVEVKLSRSGKNFNVVLVPEIRTSKKSTEDNRGFVGVGFALYNVVENETTTIDFIKAVPKSVEAIQNDILNTVAAISRLFKSELSTKSLSGPVAIMEFSGKAAFNGLYSYINLMALISVGIGFFNLLPLPMLDGGQVVLHSVEAIRRKDFTAAVTKKVQIVGICILLSFFLFVMIQDLRNLF